MAKQKRSDYKLILSRDTESWVHWAYGCREPIMSQTKIANTLNDRGIAPPFGTSWTQSLVSRVARQLNLKRLGPDKNAPLPKQERKDGVAVMTGQRAVAAPKAPGAVAPGLQRESADIVSDGNVVGLNVLPDGFKSWHQLASQLHLENANLGERLSVSLAQAKTNVVEIKKLNGTVQMLTADNHGLLDKLHELSNSTGVDKSLLVKIQMANFLLSEVQSGLGQ